MVKIPFQDLGRLHASIRPELDEAFDRILKASSFVGSASVTVFEEAFASAHGLAAAASCGSGTDALALAFRALELGPGDEVVVPSMTFVATAEAVVHVGATPVLADVDAQTLLLTPETVEPVLTTRTRAIVPVHLYGHVVPPADLRVWRDQGLLVIEDAAQAHLASADDIGVGHVGHAACFSFYPGKNLGALGDGGLVASDDTSLIAEVTRLRDHGRRTKYEHDVIGWASRLDGLQAAFLGVKLTHLAEWTSARRHLAASYRHLLSDVARVRLVPWHDGAVHHLLVVRVAPTDRARVIARLAEGGIATGIHYPVPLSRQVSLVEWARATPTAELSASEVLSLPMDPLMTEADVARVCGTLADALG